MATVNDWLACVTWTVTDFTVSTDFFEWNGEEDASSGKAEKLNAENEEKLRWMDEYSDR